MGTRIYRSSLHSNLTVPVAAGSLSVALGVFALAGWVLDISWIKSVIPGTVEMKANTAAGLPFGGLSLVLLASPASGRRFALGPALAALVAVLGLATGVEYAFGWHLPIGQFLFRDTADAYNVIRGRTSPYSPVAFAGIGLGLLALSRPVLRPFVLVMAVITWSIGALSCLGYLRKASELITDSFLSPVAINATVAFVTFGIGLVAAIEATVEPIKRGLSSVEKKALTGFAIAFVLPLAAGGYTCRSTAELAQSDRRVIHTRQVRRVLSNLYTDVSDAESSQRNYLLSGSPEHRQDYRTQVGEARRDSQSLIQLVADDPDQLRRVAKIRILIDRRLDVLAGTTALFEHSGFDAARVAVAHGEGRKLMPEIRAGMEDLDAFEARLLGTREAAAATKRAHVLICLCPTLGPAATGFTRLFPGIQRELSARAAAEASLRRSEESLAVTLHSIDDAVLATATEGRITRMNFVAAELIGWKSSETQGRPVDKVFHIVNEQTREPAEFTVWPITPSSSPAPARSGPSRTAPRPSAITRADLLPLFTEIRQDLATTARDRAINWKIGLLPTARGDPMALKQVFATLLGNAVKYTRQRDPAEIETGWVDGENADAVLLCATTAPASA